MPFCSSWKELLCPTKFSAEASKLEWTWAQLQRSLCWPAIVLTLINNLGTIGTWCSSPSHIIHSIHSSAVLPLLSFGALRTLGSSPTNRSLVSFRTRRAWEWLVCARLACVSWKQKDLLKKPCYFFSVEVQLKISYLKSQSYSQFLR